MCGFVGIFRSRPLEEGDLKILNSLNSLLSHRGPDDHGVWSSNDAGVALGHRRLSIIDLSPAGAQPMQSSSGRHTIAFNGEIYNFEELRAYCDASGKGPKWRGHSDTEVFLEAIELFGLEKTLERSRGMYAFALWDAKDRSLVLGRDRMGEKPLYVSKLANGFIFGSELKALIKHPEFDRTYDREAIALCIRHGYIRAPHTLFEHCFKLEPGQIVVLAKAASGKIEYSSKKYFDLLSDVNSLPEDPIHSGNGDPISCLDDLLVSSVEKQMIADVPLGAFLSGGIDSSLVTSIMAKISDTQVETFTVGFEEAAFDEATHAREIASHLGVHKNEIFLTGEMTRDLVMEMPHVYDEPFTDESQLPTYFLCKFARERVKVCLSGDGGDELFAGYRRYHSFLRKWDSGPLGWLEKQAQKLYTDAMLTGIVRPLMSLNKKSLLGKSLFTQEVRLMERLEKSSQQSALNAYEKGFTHIDRAEKLVIGAGQTNDPLIDRIDEKDWSALRKITTLDMLRYLPDDILVKVDRAAMASSLETRIPMLDPRIVRFAAGMSDTTKLMNGEGKGLLKALLARYVPRSLWDRPKQGFGIPTSSWLKGPLNELASEMFSKSALEQTGVLDPRYVNEYWLEFSDGPGRRSNILWTLFTVQLYLHKLSEKPSLSEIAPT